MSGMWQNQVYKFTALNYIYISFVPQRATSLANTGQLRPMRLAIHQVSHELRTAQAKTEALSTAARLIFGHLPAVGGILPVTKA